MPLYSYLVPVLGGLFWAAIVVGVITLDQRRRRAIVASHRGDDRYDEGIASFEDTSLTPYIILAIFTGGLALPVYFYATRKTLVAALVGLGLGLGTMAVAALFTTTLGGLMERARQRGQIQKAQDQCMAGEADRCDAIANAFYMGVGVTQDVARAIALRDRGCQAGEPLLCARLVTMPPGDHVPPETVASSQAQGVKLCATSHDPVCSMFRQPGASPRR